MVGVCYVPCLLVSLGLFDETRAGKRMKLPIPETWETQVSMLGNKAEVWQQLIGQFYDPAW